VFFMGVARTYEIATQLMWHRRDAETPERRADLSLAASI